MDLEDVDTTSTTETSNYVDRRKKKKIKQYNYKPRQAQGIPGGCGSKISRQSTYEGGKVVSPTHRPPLPPGNIPGILFC